MERERERERLVSLLASLLFIRELSRFKKNMVFLKPVRVCLCVCVCVAQVT